MKKHLGVRVILTMLIVFTLCTSAFAAETRQEGIAAYTIIVNGQTLDLDDLPLAPYKKGETVMVPLRKIGETLGYKVGWDSKTKAISIDDEYIQKATLFNGTTTVIFEGRLQVINLNRKIENSVQTTVYSGYTYVPMEFFEEFFNDVTVEDMTIKIVPSMCEIDTTLKGLSHCELAVQQPLQLYLIKKKINEIAMIESVVIIEIMGDVHTDNHFLKEIPRKPQGLQF